MIRAYSSDYLSGAQRNLGNMFDFAIDTCGIDPDRFASMFITSGIAEQFEKGNPAYIAGKSGCELARDVIKNVTDKEPKAEDKLYADKSPEFWAGWALCYYQWHSTRPFGNILAAVPLSEIIGMYYTLHEADISKFVENMDEKLRSFYIETKLARARKNIGMTQEQLADDSGISVRMIQKYEQRKNDINSAKASTLLALSKALNCNIEDLLEY